MTEPRCARNVHGLLVVLGLAQVSLTVACSGSDGAKMAALAAPNWQQRLLGVHRVSPIAPCRLTLVQSVGNTH